MSQYESCTIQPRSFRAVPTWWESPGGLARRPYAPRLVDQSIGVVIGALCTSADHFFSLTGTVFEIRTQHENTQILRGENADTTGHDRTRPDTKSDISDTAEHDTFQNTPDTTGHYRTLPDTTGHYRTLSDTNTRHATGHATGHNRTCYRT